MAKLTPARARKLVKSARARIVKLTPAKAAKERDRLTSFIEQAQYEYNCAFDGKIEANNRYILALNDLKAATEYRSGCEANFDDAEQRLFHFEEELEEFNKKYPEDD